MRTHTAERTKDSAFTNLPFPRLSTVCFLIEKWGKVEFIHQTFKIVMEEDELVVVPEEQIEEKKESDDNLEVIEF